MEFDKVIRKRTATRSFNERKPPPLQAGEDVTLNDNIEPICLLPIGYKTDDYLESPMHNVRKELEEMVRYM